MRYRNLAIGLAFLGAVGVWQVRAVQGTGATTAERQDTAELIRHGEYLTHSASMCVDCHTPRNSRGELDRARDLQGADVAFAPIKEDPDFAMMSPDVTSKGLIADWGEDRMIKFLKTGLTPEGDRAASPMPAYRFNDRDARAITLYLKSLGEPRTDKK